MAGPARTGNPQVAVPNTYRSFRHRSRLAPRRSADGPPPPGPRGTWRRSAAAPPGCGRPTRRPGSRRRLRRRRPATPASLGSRTPASGPCAAGETAVPATPPARPLRPCSPDDRHRSGCLARVRPARGEAAIPRRWRAPHVSTDTVSGRPAVPPPSSTAPTASRSKSPTSTPTPSSTPCSTPRDHLWQTSKACEVRAFVASRPTLPRYPPFMLGWTCGSALGW
jgi:hypothetical protein